MGSKTTSKTERDSSFVERIFGDHHYKTTITDGDDSVERRGRSSEESQKRASESWDKEKRE